MDSKPILDEQFSDNGEHSHWHLINSKGEVLWSDFPEETIARGQKVLQVHPHPSNDSLHEIFEEVYNEFIQKYPQNKWQKLELIKKSVDYLLAIEAMKRFYNSQAVPSFATSHIIKKFSEEWQIQREATNRINYLQKKSGWRGFITGAEWMYDLFVTSFKTQAKEISPPKKSYEEPDVLN